jgi:hypothetical protein
VTESILWEAGFERQRGAKWMQVAGGDMQPEDLIGKIDHLLQKPLSGGHLSFLRSARKKAQETKLAEFDLNYISYLWAEFGPSRTAKILETLDIVSAEKPVAAEAKRKPQRAPIRHVEPRQTLTTMETELDEVKKTITRLRETGKRAVAQRDHWEAVAKTLQKAVADLQRKTQKPDRKFEEAKRAFAKLYHPNASVSRSPLETMLRGEIFKEFWAELERIESQS